MAGNGRRRRTGGPPMGAHRGRCRPRRAPRGGTAADADERDGRRSPGPAARRVAPRGVVGSGHRRGLFSLRKSVPALPPTARCDGARRARRPPRTHTRTTARGRGNRRRVHAPLDGLQGAPSGPVPGAVLQRGGALPGGAPSGSHRKRAPAGAGAPAMSGAPTVAPDRSQDAARLLGVLVAAVGRLPRCGATLARHAFARRPTGRHTASRPRFRSRNGNGRGRGHIVACRSVVDGYVAPTLSAALHDRVRSAFDTQ